MRISNKNTSVYEIIWLVIIVFSSISCAKAETRAQTMVHIDASDANITSPHNMPTSADIAIINDDLKNMLDGMFSGNVDVFMEKTHPALFPLLGGEENFRKFTQEALAQLDSMGIKILSTEYQKPGRFYLAGEQMLSIVPRMTSMEIQGYKIKTTGFMVAIKNTLTNTWTYLDGSGLREDKSMLWEMFPELGKDIQFPENIVEEIDPS